MSKVDRAVHGPSWAEVILGAVLSLVLGIALGAVAMILKPAIQVKEPPKDPVPGAVYYIEGLRGDTAKARQALAKRKAFVDGQSIKVTEDEINALAAAAKPDQKADAAATGETIATGLPNVRIRDGVLQVGMPVAINLLGIETKVIAQARGGFEKNGNVFEYEPTEMYLGSCPVQRLPFLGSYLRGKVVSSQGVPDDIAAAWAKLANVTIEGNTLSLVMP